MKTILSVVTGVVVYVFSVVGVYAQNVSAPTTLFVHDTQQLMQAVNTANQSRLATDIILADGHYVLNQRISLKADNIRIYSRSGDRNAVVISGQGMRKTNAVEILFDISGSNISLSGFTLQNSANHLIQLRAERNADNFSLNNCVLRDAYQQLFKVSATNQPNAPVADGGKIENCLFEYSNKIGPQYYIGGIDAHRSKNWLVQHNTFKNIASPADQVAQFAIHFWRNSADNTVINNTIIDCDRGIGFGLGEAPGNNADGGTIADNVIVNSNPAHKFADAAIVIEGSANVRVDHNVIFLNNAYPNAIEYRFASTFNTIITNNISNKAIKSRNGGEAILQNNQTDGAINQGIDTLKSYFKRL